MLVALWVTGNFNKIYVKNENVDKVTGRFYKSFPGPMSFVVKEPIDQIITYKADTMIVYYPSRNLAFKIKSMEGLIRDNGVTMGLVESMKALQRMGYIFLKRSTHGDTIYSYWTHEKLKTNLLIVYDRQQRVYKVSIRNDKNVELYRIQADNYIQIDTVYFPLKLVTVAKQDSDMFEFSNVKTIPVDSLPEVIREGTLPDTVRVILKNFNEK